MLCYHAVSETWDDALAVRPVDLERQLEWLLERGYTGSTFSSVAAAEPPVKQVAVTFDDAYHSVRSEAEPVLRALGLTGTVFAPTLFIGSGEPMAWPGIDHWRGTAHAGELHPLTWGDLGELAKEGWEIGSHGRSHPRLTHLDDALLAEELRESRAAVEMHVGRPCRSIAYPYGDVDARVVRAAGAAGYVAGGLLDRRLFSPSPLTWPRVGIYRSNSMLQFKIKVGAAARSVPGHIALDAVRRLRSHWADSTCHRS